MGIDKREITKNVSRPSIILFCHFCPKIAKKWHQYHINFTNSMSPYIRVMFKTYELVFCSLRRAFLTHMCHQNTFFTTKC